MQAGHVLLGRPWQFDKDATHNGRTNFYSFMHDSRRINLSPLSPAQVHEMQVKLSKDSSDKSNFLINSQDVRKSLSTGSRAVLMVYREILSIGTNDRELPAEIKEALEKYKDVFPKEMPPGLPPLRGIEHHINFVPGAALPNRPAYRVNPEEAKELES